MKTISHCIIFALMLTARASLADLSENVISRGNLVKSHHTFTQTKKGHVAFLGGSITQMNGYRPMMMDVLKKRFPETAFTFTNAGLSSTCSTTGAFRLQEDILQAGPVDLLYLEFAVNDDQDAGHNRAAAIRGFEGIVRHLKTHSPMADIIVTYFVNENLMKHYRDGKVATSIAAHEEVAKHYDLSVINLAKEIQEQIDEGKMTWKQFGGVHPAAFGNRHCTKLHEQLLDHMRSKKTQPPPENAKLPPALDAKSYARGQWLSVEKAEIYSDWKVEIPHWKSIPGGFRQDYAGKPCLVATKPGASAALSFSGTAIGAFVLAGPDAGQIEYQIDGGNWQSLEVYHHHSRGLHYPRTVIFASDLADAEHQLTIKVSATHHTSSKGTAIRIMHFGVN